MYGTLLVSDLSISISIFIVVVFSWLFLRYDGYIYLCSIVCCEQIQVLGFLKMMSVKFLSMTFILLGFGKLGFVKRLLNGEHYERVDVRS